MKYLKHLKIAFERGKYKNPLRGQVRGPQEVYQVFQDMRDETKEVLLGAYLNDKLDLTSYEILTIGSASTTLVVPDEIFRGAILTRSPYFILIHNHPSGKAEPSAADREVRAVLTEQSRIMRRTLRTRILEHVRGGRRRRVFARSALGERRQQNQAGKCEPTEVDPGDSTSARTTVTLSHEPPR